MKPQIRVIKSQSEYDNAMSRLSALMDQDPVSGSEEEAELELLALVIEAYESKIVPATAADPIEAVLLRMEQLNISKKDLVPLLGSASKTSEVLSRKRPLSLAMIRALHKGLHIPAEILISAPGDDTPDITVEPAYDYSRFPIKEMHARGYFKPFDGPLAQARELAEELISGFLRIGTKSPYALLRAPLHQEGAREMDESALLVWRVAAIKKARAMQIKTAFNRNVITDVWLREGRSLRLTQAGQYLLAVANQPIGNALADGRGVVDPQGRAVFKGQAGEGGGVEWIHAPHDAFSMPCCKMLCFRLHIQI